jgi:hypothetical protein
MATVVVRHRVGDFDTWMGGHQDRVNLFESATVSNFKTFQDFDDPNSVVMVIEVEDMARFGEVIKDPQHEHLKEKHTVINPIIVSMQVET